jgi:hypothetical protein
MQQSPNQHEKILRKESHVSGLIAILGGKIVDISRQGIRVKLVGLYWSSDAWITVLLDRQW